MLFVSCVIRKFTAYLFAVVRRHLSELLFLHLEQLVLVETAIGNHEARYAYSPVLSGRERSPELVHLLMPFLFCLDALIQLQRQLLLPHGHLILA